MGEIDASSAQGTYHEAARKVCKLLEDDHKPAVRAVVGSYEEQLNRVAGARQVLGELSRLVLGLASFHQETTIPQHGRVTTAFDGAFGLFRHEFPRTNEKPFLAAAAAVLGGIERKQDGVREEDGGPWSEPDDGKISLRSAADGLTGTLGDAITCLNKMQEIFGDSDNTDRKGILQVAVSGIVAAYQTLPPHNDQAQEILTSQRAVS